MTADLNAGLRELARKRSASAPEAAVPARSVRAPAKESSAAVVRRGIAALLRGEVVPAPPVPESPPSEIPGAEVVRGTGGRCCRLTRSVESMLPDVDVLGDLSRGLARLAERDPEDVYPGVRPAAGVRAEDVVVMDLETTGFWGCPIFLVGLLLVEEGRLRSVQFLARDYPEERAILAEAAARLTGSRLLVTFNGKSYDVPCLKERSSMHRVRSRAHRLPHVDVLHASRRRWKEELPDCRLQTLEREITGLHRTGDIPSSEIPAVYHEFVATRDAEALRPVLHHARVDVLTTARLFAELAADPPAPLRPRKRRRKKPAAAPD